MSIKKITTEDLRRMNDSDGLVLQGCGGDLQEWLDGINSLFTEEKLLLGERNLKTFMLLKTKV